MFEIKITLNAPELTEAINKLADAMTCGHTACNCHSENTTEVVEETVEEVVEETMEEPTTEVVEEVVNPTIPVSVPQTVQAVPTAPTAPISTPEPVPTAPTKQYTLDMIAKAGTVLVDAGKIAEVTALLGKYGVEVLTALNPSKYADVAADLRALGAPI